MITINNIDLYDYEDLCKRLNISRPTLIKIKKNGLLPVVRIGRKYYATEEAISEFLNGSTRKNLSATR